MFLYQRVPGISWLWKPPNDAFTKLGSVGSAMRAQTRPAGSAGGGLRGLKVLEWHCSKNGGVHKWETPKSWMVAFMESLKRKYMLSCSWMKFWSKSPHEKWRFMAGKIIELNGRFFCSLRLAFFWFYWDAMLYLRMWTSSNWVGESPMTGIFTGLPPLIHY